MWTQENKTISKIKKKKKRNEMTVILYMSGSDGSSEKWTFSE